MAGKGSGKTGTVRAAGKNGYRNNSSKKGTIGHKASGNPKQAKVVLSEEKVVAPNTVGGYNP